MLSSNQKNSPIDSKVDTSDSFCLNLLHQMTLEEKVGQMVQADLSWKQDVKQLLREGRIGSLLTIRDPKVINEYQHIAVDESRLGIPLIMGNDIIHGYRTIFPIPLALACSWDTQLVEEVARASIAEAIAHGTTLNFTPMVDISRDPRWGRIAEGAGEDPLVSAAMGQAWVRGIQGYHDDTGRCAAACVKHYAAYGAAESGKDYNTTDMSERRLREEYLPGYKAALDAGARTIMTSFNDLNGVPATANPLLLKQILRREWGFEGAILSDYDSIGELILHGFARDHREAALRSVLAGVDIDMMGNAYAFHLVDLVLEGKVPEAVIDAAVLRILKLKYELGLFDHPYLDEQKAQDSILLPETLDLAEKAAAESIVLLKNDDSLLPLRAEGKTIALIGPMVDERQSLMGCWSFDGRADEVETLQEVLKRTLPSTSTLLIAKGCSIEGQEKDFKQAVNAAEQADLVILALGEPETMSGEAHSRAHLGLPGYQQELVNAVLQTGKPVVAAIFAGRPLVLTSMAEKVPAILYSWHGGTRSARGFCDVLLGKVNPSGKLTTSFPRCEGQIPVYYAHKSTGRPVESTGTLQFNEAHKSSYIDETSASLYPFGFGLSYTHFQYADLKVITPVITKTETLKVSAVISNTGNVAGTEIVQLYVRDLVGEVTRPVKELKDFKRITLQPGEKQVVEFDLPAEKLSFLGMDLQPIVEAGEFKVWIAPNSSEGLMGDFRIAEE